MAETHRPALRTITLSRGFADTLATHLLDTFGREPLSLAQGVVILPSNRSLRAVSDALLRASGGGLLLPRLVTLGGLDADEMTLGALDADDADLPPAVDPVVRRFILAQLVRRKAPVSLGEALRLAGDLGRTLDQLTLEEIAPAALREPRGAEALAEHWAGSLAFLDIVLEVWPRLLALEDRIDAQERRRRQIDALARTWWRDPPEGFVVAAGITDGAPAVARLLRTVAALPKGLVVFPGLDLAMPEDEWDALGPHEEEGRPRRAIEIHPQFRLKRLLDRMGFARGEVEPLGAGDDRAVETRMRTVANALRPAGFTGRWIDPDQPRSLPGVTLARFATSAQEAQAIALRLRELLKTPGMTAALVTPDRLLATRVSAHLARWGVAIDDSAGRPLASTASGTLPILLAEAAAERFAPVALLAVLKHPLVQAGEPRLGWLDDVRGLDLALRGPRPAPGLAGLDRHFTGQAAALWAAIAPVLAPLETAFAEPVRLEATIAALREAADGLSGGEVWAGPAGRALGDAMAAVEQHAGRLGDDVAPGDIAPLLATMLGEVAVRPPQGGHSRLAIYGLIEARFQRPDLMILGGLNEGVWPGAPTPDPSLAPRIRAELGLPGLERRIGEDAHDFAMALGAPQVLVTRSARDAGGPAVPSRFWLRLEAVAGASVERDEAVQGLLAAIDWGGEPAPAPRPRPSPPAAERARRISVTEVDRLNADPFSFYARRMLGLMPLDAVDAEPSAAWRGTAVHEVLERWAKDDRCDPAALRARAEAMLRDERAHPMMRALWQPRLMLAIDWIAAEMAAGAAAGRHILAVEDSGTLTLAGVELRGKVDRIDRRADGTLAIVDYKTGKPPSTKAVAAGYSLQLGLLGLIAERGGFAGVAGEARAFEYWSLARNKDGGFGAISSPTQGRNAVEPERFVALALKQFEDAAERWLTGSEPFTAVLHPEHAPYGDYDQLMRRDEWYGRG